MIRQGRATVETVDMMHPRNVITRCLGPDQNVQIDIEGPFSVQAGDRFVICSDGLTNHLSDTEIGAIAGNLPPTEASRLMVDLTNCRGGSDNVTVVVTNVEQFPAVVGPVVDTAEPTASRQVPDETKPATAGHELPGALSCRCTCSSSLAHSAWCFWLWAGCHWACH